MKRILMLLFAALAVSTAAAQTPVVTRGPYLQTATPTSMIVRWRTNIPCDSIVQYGSAFTALTSSASNSTLTTEHTVQLSGLTPDTKVFYALASTGAGVLAGADSQHFFITPPPVGQVKPTHIWVVGDSGTANNNARAVRDAYYAHKGSDYTDLMLMLGDNAYNTGTDAEYQVAMFQGMYEDLLRQTVVWPAYGNHDSISANANSQSGPYFDIFNLPKAGEAGGLPSGTEAYYSFDYSNIHFIVLDSQTSSRSPTGAMATWLQNDLAANTLDWTIALWHHPPYSKGSHDSDVEANLVQMRQNILPILEAAGVDLVLGGHSHAYERSFFLNGHYGSSSSYNPALHAVSTADGRVGLGGGYQKNPNAGGSMDGCVYVVAGASGKISGGSFNHPTSFISMPMLGSLLLEVNGCQLDARYINDQGLLIDFFTITKMGVTPVQTTHLPILQAQFWKYEDSGTNLGTAWQQPNYDDSAWASGMAPLGFGETWINTTVSNGGNPSNVLPTTYFRREFFVSLTPADIRKLQVAMLYDDGYVMYLNGVEVARSASMPPGPVSYTTLAGNHEAVDYELVDLTAFKSLIVPGRNVLAVEVHQSSATSSDLVLEGALVLEGGRSFLEPQASGAVLNAQGNPESLFRINGTDGGFGRSVEVKVGEAFTFTIDPPSVLGGAPAPFTLFGYFGTPTVFDVFPLPNSLGDMIFPPAFPGVFAPLSFLVGDNFIGLPGSLVFTNPAPWTATNPGLGFAGVFTFQGWIATGPNSARTFNAIRMNVTP